MRTLAQRALTQGDVSSRTYREAPVVRRPIIKRKADEDRTADVASRRYREPRISSPSSRQRARAFDHHVRNRPGVCEPSGCGNGHSDRPGQRDDSGTGTQSKAMPCDTGLTRLATALSPSLLCVHNKRSLRKAVGYPFVGRAIPEGL
jgi:hypothetical protein